MIGFFSSSEISKPKKQISSIPLCGSCGLSRTCRSPKMQVSGKGLKKILLISEAPDEIEDRKGSLFVGESGQKLRSFLSRLGIDIDTDCWKLPAVGCRPLKDSTPDYNKITACSPNVFKAIKKLKPNVIILLGGVAVQSVIGTLQNENITNRNTWMGWNIPHQDLNTWICPTYHPSYLLRMQDSVAEKLLKIHLKKAIHLCESKPWETSPDYTKEIDIEYNTDNAAKLLNKMTEKGGIIAFDYETTCLKPEYDCAEIVSCSVCWQGKKTIAYPFSGKAVEATRNLLASPIKKIACNLKFEHRWTKKILNLTVKNWIWDTMIAAHVLDNRPSITGLKFQAFVLLGQKSYNDHIEPYLKSDRTKTHKNRIHEISIKDLLLYNGLDSLLEYKVAEIQMKQFGVDTIGEFK